jgi:hypothetical protein
VLFVIAFLFIRKYLVLQASCFTLFNMVQSHIFSEENPLSPSVIAQIADAAALDEISNIPGAVRHHIYWHGKRDKETNTLMRAMLFWVYQTTRHGPQNGYRLLLVHQGYHIASPTKPDGELEDDIDLVEKPIPQGHKEVIILGERPHFPASDDET